MGAACKTLPRSWAMSEFIVVFADDSCWLKFWGGVKCVSGKSRGSCHDRRSSARVVCWRTFVCQSRCVASVTRTSIWRSTTSRVIEPEKKNCENEALIGNTYIHCTWKTFNYLKSRLKNVKFRFELKIKPRPKTNYDHFTHLNIFLCNDWYEVGEGSGIFLVSASGGELCCLRNPGGCVKDSRILSRIRGSFSTLANLTGAIFPRHSSSKVCKMLNCLPRSIYPSKSVEEEGLWCDVFSFGTRLCKI